MIPNAQIRAASVFEVFCAFALVHVSYRTLMRFTSIGALDVRAGTNLIPGLVMIFFTCSVLLLRRKRFASYGLSLDRVPVRFFASGLLALVCLPVLLAIHFQRPTFPTLVTSLSLVVGAGVGEEVFFRGYVQSRINEAFGRPLRVRNVCFGVGLFLSTLLFGFIHTLNTVDYFQGRITFAWGYGAMTLGTGLLLAVLREATGSIAAGVIAHSAIDVLAQVPTMVS